MKESLTYHVPDALDGQQAVRQLPPSSPWFPVALSAVIRHADRLRHRMRTCSLLQAEQD